MISCTWSLLSATFSELPYSPEASPRQTAHLQAPSRCLRNWAGSSPPYFPAENASSAAIEVTIQKAVEAECAAKQTRNIALASGTGPATTATSFFSTTSISGLRWCSLSVANARAYTRARRRNPMLRETLQTATRLPPNYPWRLLTCKLDTIYCLTLSW